MGIQRTPGWILRKSSERDDDLQPAILEPVSATPFQAQVEEFRCFREAFMKKALGLP
jgi:hypothetical protein